MKINIVSTDPRYAFVSDRLSEKGIEAQLCAPRDVDACDFLLLSVKRELDDCQLKEILVKIDKETVVLCGSDERIGKLFGGKIINYSLGGDFVEKNAYLTAEATVSFLHSKLKDCICGKRVFVSGYGRIGRALCRILHSLGAEVFAYARRAEIKAQINEEGIINASLDRCIECEIVINTVPSVIYSYELISKIPRKALIVELASYPYGFAEMERVLIAGGLPGKILPVAAADAVLEAVLKIVSSSEMG